MPKNLLYLYSLLFFFVTQSLQAADSTAILYASALQAQTNSQHKKAIELYEQILDSDQVSAALYNNLGLAYHQDKQLGKAIVQFERALKLAPNNRDVQHNLSAAQQRIKENFQATPSLFFICWWNEITHSLSSANWGLLFLFFLFSGTGGIGVWYVNNKKSFRLVGITLLLFSIFPLLWGFQQKNAEYNSKKAIIIKKQVGLRKSPELSSDEIELIFEGVKVIIIDQKNSWVHIQLPNNLIGWVPNQMIERI